MDHSQSYLSDSIRNFNEKKYVCLAFVDEVIDLVRNYEESFPSKDAVDQNYESLQSINMVSLEAVKQKIQDSRLKILIAGQFKTGKSTLVNALLSEGVLPAYSTPCTAVITEVVYGESPKATLSFKEKLGVLPNDLFDKARIHIEQHKDNVPDLDIISDNLGDELENYLVIPLSDKEQQESVAESPYALCRLYWPLDICLNGAVVIDSPGLNEATSRDKTTMDYVPQVDMILHVLNALQCYGKPDEDFIHTVKALGNPPMLFLVNRFDQINNDKERERLRQYAISKLAPHSIYKESGIFFLSAQLALNGRMNGDFSAYEKSKFIDFEKKISEIFNNERCKIKLGNVSSVCNELEKMRIQHIPILKHLLDKNVDELEKKFIEQENSFADLEKRKDRISEKICKDVDRFHRELRVSIKDCFLNFSDSELASIIHQTELPPIRMLHMKKDQDRCVKILNDATQKGMHVYFETWSKEEGQKVIKRTIDEINDSIEWDMRQFYEQIVNLRMNMDLPDFSDMKNLEQTGLEEFVPNLIGGAAAGGGVAYGAVFLATRFLAVLGGPVGWAITGVATIVSALYVAMNVKGSERKIKETFMQEARKSIHQNRSSWAEEIAKGISTEFDSGIQSLSRNLEQKIEDIKRPIQEAIQQLKSNQENLGEKKKQLDTFSQKCQLLNQKGRQILVNL